MSGTLDIPFFCLMAEGIGANTLSANSHLAPNRVKVKILPFIHGGGNDRMPMAQQRDVMRKNFP